MSESLLHLTSRTAWLAAQQAGAYATEALAGEGFIHCSRSTQILRVANTFYAGQRGLVLLVIDPARLRPEVRWEPGTEEADELFPHVYGPINLAAVTAVLDFNPDGDGRFTHLPL